MRACCVEAGAARAVRTASALRHMWRSTGSGSSDAQNRAARRVRVQPPLCSGRCSVRPAPCSPDPPALWSSKACPTTRKRDCWLSQESAPEQQGAADHPKPTNVRAAGHAWTRLRLFRVLRQQNTKQGQLESAQFLSCWFFRHQLSVGCLASAARSSVHPLVRQVRRAPCL